MVGATKELDFTLIQKLKSGGGAAIWNRVALEPEELLVVLEVVTRRPGSWKITGVPS